MSWVVFAVIVGGVSFAVPVAVRELRKIRGPVQPGLATVLSLRQFGSVAANGPARMVCRLRLQVQAPGAEPYEAVVWHNIAPWDLGSVAVGTTVPIQISTSNPKRVRLTGR